MKTETQQQLLYIHTAFDKVDKLHNLTTERGNKMKTIKIENDNLTLDEFKAKWQWSTEQFLRLNTFKGDFYAKWQKLDLMVQELIEEKFKTVYEHQNREVA